VLIPDEAHGTNPASAAIAGYEIVTVPTADNGMIDIDTLAGRISEKTAAIMLTNPNTLGLFNSQIEKVEDARTPLRYPTLFMTGLISTPF